VEGDINLKKLFNKKNVIIGLILVVLPIIIEFSIFQRSGIDISLKSIFRLGYMYSIYVIILVYKILEKYSSKIKIIFDFLIKYRYIIGLIAFIFMVIFKLSFSSIGSWRTFVSSQNNQDTTLIGASRGIRSDEWLVQSTFALGQSMNKQQFYPLINENVRATEGQNMLMVYANPVCNITILARPQNLGFLLLGRDYGFSWYFAMKMILLVLFSIEIAMIISKKNSFISIIGGLWIAFSPGIMWWFSSTGDIYLHAFAIITIFYYYIRNTEWKVWKKIFLGVAMSSSIAGFVFCYYPPFQIPIALVILAFIAVEFIQNRKKLKKIDYIIMSVSLFAGLALIGYYYIISKDAINAMLNTAYPGKRDTPGGGLGVNCFINYFTNIFTTITSNRLAGLSNQSEISSFIYPFVALLTSIVIYFKTDFKNKIKDKDNFLTVLFIIVYLILFLWCFIGFGTFLSRITLFNMCPPARVFIIFGLVGVMLCISLISKMGECRTNINKFTVIFSIIVCFIDIILIKWYNYDVYLDSTKQLILIPILFFMNYLFITKNRKAFLYLIFILTFISGIIINPIEKGTDVIYNTKTSAEIQKICDENKDSLWIGNTNINAQYLIANGAKTLNGVNYYPNLNWINKIDPEGKFEKVYNRYAHISVDLGNETNFTLISEDSYKVQMTYKNLKEIGINFILSSQSFSENIMNNFNLKVLYSNDFEKQYIYSVN
jgi:hypothetical protein